MKKIIVLTTCIFIYNLAKSQERKLTVEPHGFGEIVGKTIDSVKRNYTLKTLEKIDFSKARAKKEDLVKFKKKIKEDQKKSTKGGRATTTQSILATATEATGNNSWITNEPTIQVPPSPNASSLINQSKENVDLYTGKINVNLPLYILKSKDIEVPIGLSYNSSGVRVNDMASWVGMSWSLDAGGAISRVLKGQPDEFIGTVRSASSIANISAFGYLNIKNRDGGILLSNFDSFDDAKKKRIIKFSDWMSLDGQDHLDGFGIGEAWDTEPDEFYFNFGKYSGKFVFDQDGNIQCIPNQNFKIIKDNSTDTGRWE